jgi:predicted ATPase
MRIAAPEQNVTSVADIAQYDAVKLLIQRVQASKRHFALNESNAAGIAEICRRLGGIAQSLQIMAFYIGVFGVEGMRRRLADRLNELHLAEGATEQRQLSLQGMADFSYDLLLPDEQKFFPRTRRVSRPTTQSTVKPPHILLQAKAAARPWYPAQGRA